MSRIKIELPETFHFVTLMDVRVYHINYGGHLGHDSLVTILHEARSRLYRQFGYEELNVEGYGTIMTDLGIEYKHQAYQQEVLKIEMAFVNIGKYTYDVVYKVTNSETGRLIAKAKTGIALFDYENQKLCVIPKSFFR